MAGVVPEAEPTRPVVTPADPAAGRGCEPTEDAALLVTNFDVNGRVRLTVGAGIAFVPERATGDRSGRMPVGAVFFWAEAAVFVRLTLGEPPRFWRSFCKS